MEACRPQSAISIVAVEHDFANTILALQTYPKQSRIVLFDGLDYPCVSRKEDWVGFVVYLAARLKNCCPRRVLGRLRLFDCIDSYTVFIEDL